MPSKIDEMDITMHYPPNFQEQAEEFSEAYELIQIFSCPEEEVELASKKTDRRCRFCGKRYPIVSFHKRAHVIPEMLGNEHWISDFECDECNSLFSKYEGDLANFIGISRTLNQTIGKKKVPKFDSVGNGIYAEKTDFMNETEAIVIGRKNSKSPFFTNGGNFREIQSTYKKPGYTPVNVYKAFLKIGLSVIPANELVNYPKALQFLQAKSADKAQLKPAMLGIYAMPIGFGSNSPSVMLYKKRVPESKYPTHYLNLFYCNFSFHFHMPLHQSDLRYYYENKKIRLPCCPPLFSKSYSENPIEFKRAELDLSSYDKKKGEEEELTIKMQGNPENLVAIDPITRKIIPGAIPGKITKLVMTDSNFILPIK